jgi:solute carrier family 25 protein 39/40
MGDAAFEDINISKGPLKTISGHNAAPISILHRSVAAIGASVVSAVIVNPLDVVKTRLQAQGGESRRLSGVIHGQGNVARSGHKMMEPYRGTVDALKRIVRCEGPVALWKGTGLSLTMALPMVGIYLPLYDAMLEYAQKQGTGYYAPLLAGTAARSIAVYCTSPIELMRVQVQAIRKVDSVVPVVTNSTCGHLTAWKPRQSMVNKGLQIPTGSQWKMLLRSMPQLWRGVGATLWRDVPFSGLYWAGVEPIRESMLGPDGPKSEMDVFWANSVAGGVAGALAGAVTTPFDVVKTRLQLYHQNCREMTTFVMMKDIFMTEGMAGLYSGWSARAAKAMPACAIVLSAYEMIKFFPME